MNIDTRLDSMLKARVRGESFSQTDIAKYCNCSKQSIFRIEQRALLKLKKMLIKYK
jgi:DNA-directed RNA polymerase specialized sigma subunit